MKNFDDEPCFVISVVSKMMKLHPQTIRLYERTGLINPKRTGGNIRLFSRCDIEQLERIISLTDMGVNLAGVEIIIDLLNKIDVLQNEVISCKKKLGEM